MTRAAILLLLLAAPATADPPARLAALRAEHAAAEAEYFRAARALPDTPAGAAQRDALWGAYDRAQAARFEAAVGVAMSDPRSPAAADALAWVLTIPRAYYLPAGVPAFDLAATFHAANPKLGPAVARLGRRAPTDSFHPREHAAAMRLVRAVAADNPDRTARGQAVAALAWQAYGRFAVAEYKRTPDADRLAADAEAAFAALAKDYSDCTYFDSASKRTLGDLAFAYLTELRTLRVGKVAPDIAGDDLDGKRFRLSDYRGKVTVLVFWAAWCGPCMEMIPQERRLAERHAGKAFALVGVNGDEDRATARTVAAREKMTWRSFWNGPDGPGGPISTAWNVDGWPEVYVLDPAGVIRYRGVARDELDAAVDALLAEAAKK